MNAVRKLLWVAVFGAAVATATAGIPALVRARPPLPDFGPVEEKPLNVRIWIGSLVDPDCDGACRRTIDALAGAAKVLEGEKDVEVVRIETPPPGMAMPQDLRSDFDPPGKVTGEKAAILHDRLRALVPPPNPPEGEILLPAFGYVGDWALTGTDGKPFGGGDLKGKAWIADFVFTRCAGPCPAMCEGMDKLVKLLPADPRLKFVSFSVDPGYDTPEVLREFATQWKADPERWKFVTGAGVYKLAYDGFKLMARPNPEPTPGNQIIHSTRFTLVDGEGWMRGLYVYDYTQPETLPATLNAIVRDTRALLETPDRVVTHTHGDRFYLVDRAGRLRSVGGEADLHRLVADARRLARTPDQLVSLRTLPRLNAVLNGTSFLFLTTGFLFILKRQVTLHKLCMTGALVASLVFLGSYVYYHLHAGSVRYPGEGMARSAYLGLLITHTILAAVVAPMALVTVWRAWRGRFDRHMAIARWTLPIWLYVSLTGILVYVLLYELA